MKNKVNEIKVSYIGDIKAEFWHRITSSNDAAEVLYSHWNKNHIALHESFKIVLLNNNNKVKGIYQISMGGITGTLVDIRILFGVVLKTLAVSIILSHNHPSGQLKPSESDKKLTQKIKKAAELFDIKVLDHLIMVPNGDFYSFADHGIL